MGLINNRASVGGNNQTGRQQELPQKKDVGATQPTAPPQWALGNGPARTGAAADGPVLSNGPAVDDATKDLVRTTSAELKNVNAQLNQLVPQLNAAQGQLAGDQKAVPWSESLNPFKRGPHEQKVDQDTSNVASLQKQVDGLRARASELDGQINQAVSRALENDPDFKARNAQLSTLQRADGATKTYLGQIDSARAALSSASSLIAVDNGVNIANQALGTSKDDLQVALAASRDMQKASALSEASTKVRALGPEGEAWRATITALGQDAGHPGSAGSLNATVDYSLPFMRTFNSDFANTMGNIENFSNAVAISSAQGRVDALRSQVSAFDDTVSSKMRTLSTSQINQVQATRSQILQ
jgi:hypothetical protein